MPRAIDLQLLALAGLAGASVGWLASRVPRRGRVGALAVLAALFAAWVLDRWFVHAVPRDLVDGRWPWVAGALVGLAVARGAGRLPVTPTAGLPPVVALALASLVGVWAGVPETSATLLAAGVTVGLAAALRLGRASLRRRAAVVVGLAPVGAAVVGSAGERHALWGGLLCSATLGLLGLGLGRRIRTVSPRRLVVATALQLVGALVAARHVAIVRGDADAALALAIAVVLGVAAVTATVLRRGQRRGP